MDTLGLHPTSLLIPVDVRGCGRSQVWTVGGMDPVTAARAKTHLIKNPQWSLLFHCWPIQDSKLLKLPVHVQYLGAQPDFGSQSVPSSPLCLKCLHHSFRNQSHHITVYLCTQTSYFTCSGAFSLPKTFQAIIIHGGRLSFAPCGHPLTFALLTLLTQKTPCPPLLPSATIVWWTTPPLSFGRHTPSVSHIPFRVCEM